MSKNGSSAGGKSGGSRKGRSNDYSPAKNAAGKGGSKSSSMKSRGGDAREAARRLGVGTDHGPDPDLKVKSGNQARKMAQQARAIAKKKAKKRG